VTPSKPPALASWMLRHLVLGNRTEALEGDLLEEFQRRRSAEWYWRQVTGAILGFSNLLRIGWVMVWTAAFAAAWIYGSNAIVGLTHHSLLEIIFSTRWIPPPFATLFLTFFIYVTPPLLLFLALTHNLSLRAFAVGLGAGFLALALLASRHAELAWPMNYIFAHARPGLPHAYLWRGLYGVLHGAPPLVAAIWGGAVQEEDRLARFIAATAHPVNQSSRVWLFRRGFGAGIGHGVVVFHS
jgi:hypothetical protein